MSGPPAHVWTPSHNPWLIAIAVTIATFMEVLDTTIVNVALPHIAGTMSASPDEATWAITSYLVANGIVLTISGWLAELLGRKRYFLICITMFTVCSFLCGIADSLQQLIIFRLAQGFFGGGLQPNQQSIILDSFPLAKRGAALGVVSIAVVIAPILGPTVGGYITDTSSWRWVFFINIPVGVIAVFANAILVEDPPWQGQNRRRGVDFVGLSLIALGLGCLEVMLDRGEDLDWFSSPFIVTMALLAGLGIFAATLWLLTADKPIVNLEVFRDRNFTTGCAMISALGVILYSSAVTVPQFVQVYLGYTATWSGLIMSPGGLVVVVLIPVVTRLIKVMQTRIVVAFGFCLLGAGLYYSSDLTPTIDFYTLMSQRALLSAGLAFMFVPIGALTFVTLPMRLRGDGAALFSMFRNVFGSVGIAGATALADHRQQIHQSYLSQSASPYHQPYVALTHTYARALEALGHPSASAQGAAVGRLYQMFRTQVAVLAYSDVFLALAAVAFAVVPLCLLASPVKAGAAAPSGGKR